MQLPSSNVVGQLSRHVLVMLCLASTLLAADFVQAQDDSSRSHSGRRQRAPFVFIQQLEVDPLPFEGPTGDAVWYGKGRFLNSRRIYDIEVRLNTTKKFPNTPEPGVITVTEMIYNISWNGQVLKEITMAGTANLNTQRLSLQEVNGRARASGWIKQIWTHPNFPMPPVKGPELVCGFMFFR